MSSQKIHIYYIDSDSDQLDKFRANFKISVNFKIFTFTSAEMLLNKLKQDIKEKTLKIVLADYLIICRDANNLTAVELLPKIKTINSNIEVIILADSDNIELNATKGNLKATAYIKKDTQYLIRLEAVVGRLISENNLNKRYRDIKISVVLFLSLILIGLVAIIYFQFF